MKKAPCMLPIRDFRVDKLQVKVFPNRELCGAAAAQHVAKLVRGLIQQKGSVSMCCGAAPSQNEFFNSLRETPNLDWPKVTAFQLDEYMGISPDDTRVLRHYLERYLFCRRPVGHTPFLAPDAANPESECERYAALLQQNPLDISCLGIGESCHLAYNDPHVAKFDDPQAVKVVEVDEMSRIQQVHDRTADRPENALVRAYTLTLPTLMRAKYVSCVAPGKVKAEAVARTLTEPISEKCPATILRRHDAAILFLDADSAEGL